MAFPASVRARNYFVRAKSLEQHREVKKVRFEFSSRGGLDRFGLTSCYNWLKLQSEESKNLLPLGNLVWETMDENLVFVFPHKERAGLQLADTVASAFFKACDCVDTGACAPEFAKLHGPRMCCDPDGNQGEISGYSVKLMPLLKEAALLSVGGNFYLLRLSKTVVGPNRFDRCRQFVRTAHRAPWGFVLPADHGYGS